LLLYIPFDGNVTPTFTRTTLNISSKNIQFGPGRFEQAICFSGLGTGASMDAIQASASSAEYEIATSWIQTDESGNLLPFSLSFWVMATAAGDFTPISIGDGSLSFSKGFTVIDIFCDFSGWFCNSCCASNAMAFAMAFPDLWSMQVISPSNVVVRNTWLHVGLSISENMHVAFYINGVEFGTAVGAAISSDNVQSSTHVIVGGCGDRCRGFTGCVDEVRVYSRALSAQEMLTLATTNGR
jgi:hypothetical protein